MLGERMSKLICEWDLGDIAEYEMGDSLVCRMPEHARKAAIEARTPEGYFSLALVHHMNAERKPLGATLQ